MVLPSGIIKPGKKYQARIFYPASASTQGHEGGARNVGSFDDLDEAVNALAVAKAKFNEGGETAVWNGPKAQRAERNAVCWLPLEPTAMRTLHGS